MGLEVWWSNHWWSCQSDWGAGLRQWMEGCDDGGWWVLEFGHGVRKKRKKVGVSLHFFVIVYGFRWFIYTHNRILYIAEIKKKKFRALIGVARQGDGCELGNGWSSYMQEAPMREEWGCGGGGAITENVRILQYIRTNWLYQNTLDLQCWINWCVVHHS